MSTISEDGHSGSASPAAGKRPARGAKGVATNSTSVPAITDAAMGKSVLFFSLLAFLALLNCGGTETSGTRPASRFDEPPLADAVSVTRDSSLRQTTYSISKDNCRLRWVTYDSEANRHVISHYEDCLLPLSQQAPLLAALLKKVLEATPEPDRYRTFYWGRLFPDGKLSTELAVRLALAAKHSPDWNTRRGAPEDGNKNGFVRDLLNTASAYPELQAVFREAGSEIRVATVEKVLVLPAGELPFFDQLEGSGVLVSDRLPFDCQAWFAILSVGKQATRGAR